MTAESGATTSRLLNRLAYSLFNKATVLSAVAADDRIPVADTSADGEVKYATPANIAGAAGTQYVLTLDIPVIGDEAVYYMFCPFAGTITSITSIIDAGISTADATITAAIGVTAVTGGAITITQSGSAAGDIDTVTPSAANVVTAGQAINFTVTGAGTSAVDAHLTVVITRT